MLFRNAEKRGQAIKENILDIKECREFLESCGYDVGNLNKNEMKEVTYFCCMRLMQDNISKLPLKLFKKNDSGIEKCNKHPLLNLLSIRSNRFMSASNFWKYVEFQRNHYGNAVVYIDTDRKGQVEALYPLDFRNLTIYIDDANMLNSISNDINIYNNTTEIWYVYSDINGEDHKLRSGEVLHFIGQTQNGITGLSVADYLKTIIQNNKYAQSYINNYFRGGLQARGIIQYTSDITDKAATMMCKRFDKMANGVKNAGKVLPLPLGFNFQQVQANMADAQFDEIQKFTTKQIMNGFGIKSFMLNDLEKSTYTNITEQQKDFYISTLQSILTMYEQELNYKLFGLNNILYWKFNVDSILRADLKTRYEAYRIGIQGGFITPNEAREKEDMPTINGGDDLICNGNMQFIKDIGAYYKKDNITKDGVEKGGEDGGQEGN